MNSMMFGSRIVFAAALFDFKMTWKAIDGIENEGNLRTRQDDRSMKSGYNMTDQHIYP
jgi:hypothetical protein